MLMRRTDKLIEVLLSEFELKKYNLTVEHMAQLKPFPVKLIEDLMEKAAEDYEMKFDIDHCRLNIQRYGDMNIYISFVEKSDIFKKRGYMSVCSLKVVNGSNLL